MVNNVWNAHQQGTLIFPVCERINKCRLYLLELRRVHNMNSRKAIQDIKGKIEVMQEEGGTRNWTGWEQLQRDLGEE